MKTTGPIDGQPQYGIPIPIEGTRTWLTPFVYTKEYGFFRDSDNFQEGGIAGSGRDSQETFAGVRLNGYPVRWHNVIFRHDDVGDSTTLLDHRAFISEVWFLGRGERSTQLKSKAILFAVTETDTSGNGELEDTDAMVIYMTDREGRNGVPVTPPEGQVDSIHLFAEEGRLAFMVRMDANGDRKYEKSEPLVPYTVTIGPGEKGIEPWLILRQRSS
ncbi:MAG: hypothetical protein R3F17_08020 [Planctomycetota bacterium]